MQSSAENLHYVFDIGDHPTVVTCLPIAAESFKLKSGLIVQMDGKKGLVQSIHISELFYIIYIYFVGNNYIQSSTVITPSSPAMLLTKCL